MELPGLASKQKRYRDILRFVENNVRDARLKPEFLKTLASYRNALSQCWSKQAITNQDLTNLSSIERALDTLYSEAHLRTALK